MPKEILYVQAGTFANFVGTHFWNAQEGYFTYSHDEEPAVYHDRSFREGLNNKGESTYCPRLLLFDRKSQFGALSDELYRSNDSSTAGQWEGGVIEYRQEPIPKSQYQTRLDQGEPEDDAQVNEDLAPDSHQIRFWSDYSRVFLHPRTLQMLPDLADWEAADGEWIKSRESFQQYDIDHDLMENEMRNFVEECDGLQGLQLFSDCPAFGGFTDAFLTAFLDEFPKLTSLAFSFLSDASSNATVTAEEPEATKALNDALSLRSLYSLSTLNVPIQHPSAWERGDWLDDLRLEMRSPYHTSALLSTHIESATLPFRLKASEHDMSSISGLLNMSGTTGTAHIAGTYPLSAAASDAQKKVYDFSAVTEFRGKSRSQKLATEYGRAQVLRGDFSSTEWLKVNGMFPSNTPTSISFRAPAYPTPTSFPRIVKEASMLSSSSSNRSSQNGVSDIYHNVFSALTTSSATSRLFASHARLAQECVDKRAEVVTRMGLEFDEIRDLKDDLWALCDQYADDGGEGREDADEEIGEDEE
ncbi:tubulin nucleotide-binding domain-like protein [Dichomitus squalens]|uniref:Tubulin nucleotide-binding domain-like protein n=1 Tax=Dichomitus squalens TaxID=114155 RepID=A0A4Q9PZ19_9APHY|nr:tubulin nucleotide-binding domain-like protein [Dichomitus squalens]TBU59889.1 tubulin nucleotide-binding domain-like protein [Dichomitus squalens]